MASPHNPDRWTFEFHTPLGATRCSYEVRDAELVFQSDDPLAGGSESVRWDRVAEGGTAAMAGMDGRGGPDLPEWVPAELEWLVLSRVGAAPGFMHPLPQGDQRHALVAAVRSQLGLRWIGDRMPLPQAQQRLGISSRNWSGLQVFGIVVGVLVLLALSIMLLGLLTTPVFFLPLGLVAGGWLVRKGLRGRRDSLAAATVPFADAGHARSGLVRLEARAVATAPLTTPVTGRASACWDAAVDAWYEGPDESGGWRQMTARFAGSVETLELETVAGRITVWLNDAQLLLEQRQWESGKDTLPAPGLAWLESQGFQWNGPQRMRVREQCVGADANVYVLGTLGKRGDIPERKTESGWHGIHRALQTGAWRRSVTAAMPTALRPLVAVFIGFMDMLTGLGTSRERPRYLRSDAPPAMAPEALLVWKGQLGHPLLVSDQPEDAALAALQRRSLIVAGIGAALLLLVVVSAFE